jgi:DNA-binding NarL/FixJ family response regulator
MPGGGGLEILGDIRESNSNLPVLVLSMHPEEQFAARVLRLGAHGYMVKESAPEELVTAVRTILKGQRYLSTSLAARLGDPAKAATVQYPHETLSEREFLVLRGIVSGKSMKEVAAELGVSAKTVTTYRTRTLRKLGLKSNAELVQYAMHHSLAA